MKNLLTCIGLICCTCLFGQQFNEPVKLGEFADSVYSNLQQVNAMMYTPKGYTKLIPPKLPDSLHFFGKNQEEIQKIISIRNSMYPYGVFAYEPLLKKDDIYIKQGHSWILLTSYFKYNNEDLTEEEYQIKVNQGLIDYPAEVGREPLPIVTSVGTQANQLINADTVIIFEPKYTFKLNDTVANYAMMQVNLIKFDLGKIRLYYYYPINEKQKVLDEIQQTWGIIRFNNDKDFVPPNQLALDLATEKKDLYLGKFSYLNDPEQLEKERAAYAKKEIVKRANQISFEANKLAMDGKTDEAIAKFKEALKVGNHIVSANSGLIFIALSKNDQDAAWDYWSEMNSNIPDEYQTKFNKGLIFTRFNQLDSAVHVFNNLANTTDSLNILARFEQAKIYVLQNDLTKAQLTFERVLNVFKQEIEKSKNKESYRLYALDQIFAVRLTYGQFLLKNNLQEQAIALMEETLEDHIKVKEAQEKRQGFAIVRELSKGSLRELYFHLSHNYASLKDTENAKIYLEKAKKNGKVLPEELDKLL